MEKPIVFIARQVPEDAVDYVARFCEVRRWTGTGSLPREALFREIADADGLLTAGTRIDDVLLDAAPRLKVVSNISVGYNNFDLDAMKRRGIIGTNTPGVLDETVADLVMALMLSVARRIPELDKLVKEGRWVKGGDSPYFGYDVHHRTLGIVGMGRIGEAIARRAKFGFGMDVLYYNRRPKPETEQELGVRYSELEPLLQQSDFVALMTPLTPETTRFFGEAHFRMMKPDAFFINVSRGQTVREEDLVKALEQGWIRGASLDVFDKEPVDKENPLLAMPNVVTLPHIGSATEQTRYDMAMLAARNLVEALTGGTPPNVVDELK